MAKGLPVIRRRLSSIKATKKVAKAMEMIATTKLKNWRNTMLEGRQYTVELFDLLQRQMKHEDFFDIPYYETPSSNAILYIVVTSNLGLCGSYNANVLSYLAKRFTPNDGLFILGEKGLKILGYKEEIFKVSFFDLFIKKCKEKIVKKFDLKSESF
jgi:F-type H+-transporting ATPase subunit gamma